jgi:hypothetical protein
MFIQLGLLISMLLVGETTAFAQFKYIKNGGGDAPVEFFQVIELTVDAAPETQPALQHRFITPKVELKPGNATSHYYRALLLDLTQPKERKEKLLNLYEQVFSQPLVDLPQPELQSALDSLKPVFEELESANGYSDCQWDVSISKLQGEQVLSLRLQEFQEMRQLARYLYLRAKLQMAQRDYDAAIHSIGHGLRLGHDCGEQPLVVCNLIGLAVANVMATNILELIAADRSPNLYWALVTIPNPLFDFREAIETEFAFPGLDYPFLQDAETAEKTPELWTRTLKMALKQLGNISVPPQINSPTDEEVEMHLNKVFPVAKSKSFPFPSIQSMVNHLATISTEPMQFLSYRRLAFP